MLHPYNNHADSSNFRDTKIVTTILHYEKDLKYARLAEIKKEIRRMCQCEIQHSKPNYTFILTNSHAPSQSLMDNIKGITKWVESTKILKRRLIKSEHGDPRPIYEKRNSRKYAPNKTKIVTTILHYQKALQRGQLFTLEKEIKRMCGCEIKHHKHNHTFTLIA